jgi:DNA-directed RNA polymerase specialized sigma24 family protein
MAHQEWEVEIRASSRYHTEGEPSGRGFLSAHLPALTDHVRDREDEPRLLEILEMNTGSDIEPDSERQLAPEFGEIEEQKLTDLLGQWRAEAGLGASDERQFALLLRVLIKSRAADDLESESFLRLMQPYAGRADLTDNEKSALIRCVKPLLKIRELTEDEKKDLARLFDRYRMRLSSKLNRSIGATLESEFGPDDVLSESYIRAETRYHARPTDPEKHYVWLYGIVHDQFYDMLRKMNAAKRGGRIKEVRIPDNSAAEIALELWQSRTGASTLASRNEFMSRVQTFLDRNLAKTDVEVVSMRVFDRLGFPEIVAELVRRAEEETDRAADYRRLLDELDSRAQEGDHPGTGNGKDVNKRRADAIRKRFTRAIGKLTGAIVAEFPELLEALPSLKSDKM